MTIRKNFVFDEAVAKHLEELAKSQNKTQTAVVQELIEEQIKEKLKEEKLEAFRNIVGSSPGLLIGKSIQSIKAEMDV